MRVDIHLGSNAFLDIGPRVVPVQDDTMQFRLHYGAEDHGLSVLLSRQQVQAMYEYLDMEGVDPFAEISLTDEMRIRVIQEPDGRTWVRIFRPSGAGKLVFLTDYETGRLYDWLGEALSGQWNGWKITA
jgi:hypothetical protein